MIDRDKVIKGLTCCQYSSRSHCDECPYCYAGLCETNDCTADLASDALALLKEQEAIVRCKDCKYWDLEHVHDAVTALDEPCKESYCQRLNAWDRWGDLGEDFAMTTDDWFCADGERR